MAEKRTVNAPPLVEYMFEVRWAARANDNLYDEWTLSLGKLFDELKDGFPRRERLFELPRELYSSASPPAGVVFDRFMPETRAGNDGELTYPLVQYGPGVVTVNSDGKSYNWRDVLRPLIHDVYGRLCSVHDGLPDRLETVFLRSIDHFPLEKKADVRSFVTESLAITMKSAVDEAAVVKGATVMPSYRCAWELPDDGASLRVAAHPGAAFGKNGVVLDIVAEVTGARLRKSGIENVVELQHTLLGTAFFQLLSEKLAHALGVNRDGN